MINSTYQVVAPGMVTLPEEDLRRYGRAGGILGHQFFQNPVVDERIYNPRMSQPIGTHLPQTTVTKTPVPTMDVSNLAGGLVKSFGPTIGAKLAVEGAKQGASGLSTIPAGIQGYYNSAGDYISNVGTNLKTAGSNTINNLDSMATKVGDFFNPSDAVDIGPLSSFGDSAPLTFDPSAYSVGGGLPSATLTEADIFTQANLEPFLPPANSNITTNGVTYANDAAFAGDGVGEGGINAAASGNYFWDPNFDFSANMMESGYGTGAFAAGASLVGDLIMKGPGALTEADTWADSITSGVGAGIGMALGGPIGAALGGYVGEEVFGKWVGNAIDSVGDTLGEWGESIGDFFGF